MTETLSCDPFAVLSIKENCVQFSSFTDGAMTEGCTDLVPEGRFSCIKKKKKRDQGKSYTVYDRDIQSSSPKGMVWQQVFIPIKQQPHLSVD